MSYFWSPSPFIIKVSFICLFWSSLIPLITLQFLLFLLWPLVLSIHVFDAPFWTIYHFVLKSCTISDFLNFHFSHLIYENFNLYLQNTLNMWKTTRYISRCYTTYQRLVTKMFRPMLGKTMEVYIDDMLIKSKERPDHAAHLQQVFDLLKTYGMKINPEKCAFGVSAGRFLGFMMTQRGIEANSSQLKAILESPAPSSRKEVQRLMSRLATLGHFISRFTDRLKPFFTALRGANRAGWNEECDWAFIHIKQYLAKPLILTSPDTGETLFVYLAVSDTAVSAALFKENEDGKQRPVFFVSKSLADAETRYNRLEQAALALQIATKKLRPYLQAHPIVVLTDLPFRSTIHKSDLSGRMARWAIELSEYDIQCRPRLSKKGQVLADFIAELPQSEAHPDSSDWWILNIDGGSRQTGVGIDL